ncbi:12329_t:CDS:2, partial [Cetraspora pellucida]
MEDIKTSKFTSNITINKKDSVVEKQAEFKMDTEEFKEKGYEEARIKLENSKEDFEKLRLILEETYQTPSKLVNKQQNQSPVLETSKDYITIWNLPTWARRSQVFESICFLRRVAHIEMIKEPCSKTRAEDLISTSIIKYAKATLLGKKVALGGTKAKKKKSITDDIKKDQKIIKKICQQCAIGIGQEISDSIRTNINLQITNLNNVYETEIEELFKKKIIYEKVQQARKKEDFEEINIAVEQHCEAIQEELKHIISSLLKRFSRR